MTANLDQTSTDPEAVAIENLARAIARGQGYNFDTLYAGPKSQVLRDAKTAYHHLTDLRSAAEPQPTHAYTFSANGPDQLVLWCEPCSIPGAPSVVAYFDAGDTWHPMEYINHHERPDTTPPPRTPMSAEMSAALCADGIHEADHPCCPERAAELATGRAR